MSVKITWLNIACSIFGLNMRHLLSTAMMVRGDEESADRCDERVFMPARLAMLQAAGAASGNNLGDVFISEFDANWETPSLMEMPGASMASAVCAWISTLHLIIDRYSSPCGVYLTTPISLMLDGIELPGAVYVDSISDCAEPKLYVLVPVRAKDRVLKLHREDTLAIAIKDEGGNSELWYSASSNIYPRPESMGSINVSLASPFGYNLIISRCSEDFDLEPSAEATLAFHDPKGSELLEAWLQ